MNPSPTNPTPGTDADRLLQALIAAAPEPAFDLNSRLNLTAHSRASDLRKLGWMVERIRVSDPSHPKGARHGYVLGNPPLESYFDGAGNASMLPPVRSESVA